MLQRDPAQIAFFGLSTTHRIGSVVFIQTQRSWIVTNSRARAADPALFVAVAGTRGPMWAGQLKHVAQQGDAPLVRGLQYPAHRCDLVLRADGAMTLVISGHWVAAEHVTILRCAVSDLQRARTRHQRVDVDLDEAGVLSDAALRVLSKLAPIPAAQAQGLRAGLCLVS